MTLNDEKAPPPAEDPAPQEPSAAETPAEADSAPIPLPGPVRHPSTFGGLFYIGVMIATLVGVALVIRDWRLGIRVVGGALAAAALLRLVLPQKDAGMLAVRHRLIDVFLLTAVSVALFVLAASIPDQPV